jgi:hypothetical protein
MHRRRTLSTLPCLFASLAGVSSCDDLADGPQATAESSLGAPTAAFPEDFGSIQAVRELPDGRVLIADPLGNAVYVVDLDAETRAVIGAEGEGPGEYRQPDAVWALPGGASLLIDLGNGRTQVIEADLTFGETSPIAMSEPRPGRTLVLALPQGVDAEGNIFTRAMGGGFGGELPDSGTILRIDRGSMDVDTVAAFKLQGRTRSVSGSANNQSVSIQPIPLSPEDAWGVAPDGAVVLARSGDNHIEWVEPAGSVTRGPAIPYDVVPIGTAEKEEYLTESGRSRGGIGISVMVDNGAMQMSFSRGGAAGRQREIDQYPWPDTKPPFYSGRIDVDPQGRAWVRRQVEAGQPATYDLFDRSGNPVDTVTLPNNRRVIGFGRGSVYVVAYDEVDLGYLERYAMP